MATTKKATKESKTTALAVTDEDAALMSFDYGDEAGDGYDPDSAGDIQIPFITILQSTSPQVKRESGVEGAAVGRLYNNVTDEVFDSIRFIPTYSKKLFVEWRKRDAGGGLIESHDLTSDVVQKLKASGTRGPWPTANGDHEILETQYLYGLVVDEDNDPTGAFFILSFTSTKLSAWRKWNTSIHTFRVNTPNGKKQPPLYAHVVELKTKEQSNKKGDFYNFLLTPANGDMKSSLVGPTSEAFSAAKELRDMILSGVAKAAQENKDAPASRQDDDDGEDSF